MKRKLLLIPFIAAFLCSNISTLAYEGSENEKTTTYGEGTIVYNNQSSISTYAINDVQSITLTQVGMQIIPTTAIKEDLVQNAEVIYRYTYRVTAKKYTGQPVINMPIEAISYTGPIKGSKFTSINSSGVGYIDIDVRGAKNFTFYCKLPTNVVRSNTINTTPTVRANYQSPFYCTGYITALESDYSGAVESAPGITGATFNKAFLAAVALNGSGKTSSGRFLHYNGSTKLYSYLNPTTATGTTPTAGKTIAVDPYYIPRAKVNSVWRRANVSIANIGTRVAEDGGGAIIQYKIDVYNGVGKSGMIGWGNAYRAVTLISVN